MFKCSDCLGSLGPNRWSPGFDLDSAVLWWNSQPLDVSLFKAEMISERKMEELNPRHRLWIKPGRFAAMESVRLKSGSNEDCWALLFEKQLTGPSLCLADIQLAGRFWFWMDRCLRFLGSREILLQDVQEEDGLKLNPGWSTSSRTSGKFRTFSRNFWFSRNEIKVILTCWGFTGRRTHLETFWSSD